MSDDDYTHCGRHHDPGTGRTLFRSGRIGVSGGRPARTFHCRFRGVTVARPCGRGGSVDYLAREGNYTQHDDLEHLAGDVTALKEAIAAVDAACRIRQGRTAERVAIATVVEMPADSTADQRRQMAESLVAIRKAQGYWAIAAVHGKGKVQPHIHVLATARPVERGTDGAWQVNRTPGNVPLRGKAAVRAARAEMAELVNEICRPAVRFHPGRLADTGIERPARRRVPEHVWHREKQRDQHPERMAEAHASHAQQRAKQQAKRYHAAMLKRRAKELKAAQLAEGTFVAVVGRRQLDSLREGAAKAPKPLAPLSDTQRATLADIHRALGLVLPDLDTHEGRAEAWGAYRAIARLRDAQKAVELPPASPALFPPPEPQTPLSGSPAGHKRPFRGRG